MTEHREDAGRTPSPGHVYLSEAVQRSLRDRLSRIEGQVRGVSRMIDQQADCAAILMQIASLRAAINQVGRIVLDGHMRTCVREAIVEGADDEMLDRLSEAMNHLLR